MKESNPSLVIPLLALAIALLAAAGIVHFTYRSVDKANQALATQQGQLRDARTRVQRSGTEKDLISQHLGNYQKLREMGFVGDEQRINWLDALRTANHSGGLFGINYEISPQRPYPFASVLSPGQLPIMQSVMKLRFQLLHEEDLMRFFELLAQQKAGVFLLDQCTMQRASAGNTMRYQPQITANCEISWITAKPAPPEGRK